MTNRRTVETPIPAELLAATARPSQDREAAPPISIHEMAIDAILVREARRSSPATTSTELQARP